MGDMADYYREIEDEGKIRIREDTDFYLSKTNEGLVSLTEGSEHPTILGIQKYWRERGKLSDKQRYCLAKYIALTED